MDQDAILYGGRSRLRPHCVRWGPTHPLERGTEAALFSAHVYCDNIKSWTGLSVEESIRMTEDRDKWRKYVHGVANPRIEEG